MAPRFWRHHSAPRAAAHGTRMAHLDKGELRELEMAHQESKS
jgi:hypothetical protein